MSAPETAALVIDGREHERHREDCTECWPGYPRACDCGGLVHAQFDDEDWYGDYTLLYRCSDCGATDGHDVE